MSAEPKLSICVPIYNKGKLLGRLFESIQRQGVTDLEIVAVNNASSDDTQAVLEAWQAKINLRVHTLPKTISLFDNWLLALSLGTGKYLKLQLADDWLPEDCLKPMLEVLEINSGLGAVFAKSVPIDESGKEVTAGVIANHFVEVNAARRNMAACRTMKEKARCFAKVRLGGSTLGDPNPLIFRRELLPKLRVGVNGLTAAFQTWPEYEIALRLFVAADVGFVDRTGSYVYFDSASSLPKVHNKDFRRRTVNMLSLHSFSMLLVDPDFRALRRELGVCYFARVALWHAAKLCLMAAGKR